MDFSPRPTVSFQIRRTESNGIASPIKQDRSRDVYPLRSLVLTATDSRTPNPSPVPTVPETWQLWLYRWTVQMLG
jgi:hypothetical protein